MTYGDSTRPTLSLAAGTISLSFIGSGAPCTGRGQCFSGEADVPELVSGEGWGSVGIWPPFTGAPPKAAHPRGLQRLDDKPQQRRLANGPALSGPGEHRNEERVTDQGGP